jgi:hypothetical protein
MENPHCNSVVFVKGIPISHSLRITDQAKNNKGLADNTCKTTHHIGAE